VPSRGPGRDGETIPTRQPESGLRRVSDGTGAWSLGHGAHCYARRARDGCQGLPAPGQVSQGEFPPGGRTSLSCVLRTQEIRRGSSVQGLKSLATIVRPSGDADAMPRCLVAFDPLPVGLAGWHCSRAVLPHPVDRIHHCS
jgi:hypothetical protein